MKAKDTEDDIMKWVRGSMRGNFRKARVKRRDIGEMNKTESAYAELLSEQMVTGDIVAWRYESQSFRLARRTTLTPDFIIIRPDGSLEVHEVKACKSNGSFLIEDDAAVKIKTAAAIYTEYTWYLCGKMPKASGGGWRIEEVKS